MATCVKFPKAVSGGRELLLKPTATSPICERFTVGPASEVGAGLRTALIREGSRFGFV